MEYGPKYTNMLAGETSPYLLQHAHNPVDWYPWGDEAFAKAKAEDKPVLVSIGYSACHWCHVMEHESFEDEATAAVMNEHFVSIKVDMEERPDVDQIYMNFVQLTTGRGGWPMNVFVTPEKLPFFGGTYFPPAPRYNMPAFKQILQSISEAWNERRDELMRSATDILGELRRMSVVEVSPTGFTAATLDTAFSSFTRNFDNVNGGFGGAPKFPPSMSLEFLLRYHRRTGNENALDMAVKTAQKMSAGGIHDQLGGGFHRYTVDGIWLVPHFEKMLYDNAQLASVYLHLFQITKDADFRSTAVDILEYVRREMLDASGGFYSAQDADSEGEEGKFFVWTPSEVEAALGKDDAEIFGFVYDITEGGNFEGHNIPRLHQTTEAAAGKFGKTVGEIEISLGRSRDILFQLRESRIKPFRDEKILTAWNGLMLNAFAEAAAILGSSEYLEVARGSADFILSELLNDGRLLRTWKDGRAKLNGYLEDSANVATAFTTLYEVTGDEKYLAAARDLADGMITNFWDADAGGFFFTSNDHEELLVRNKDLYDNATPSGNSAAADVLLRLARILADDRYERFAMTTLRLTASQMLRHPQGFGRALSAMEFAVADKREVVIVGEDRRAFNEIAWSEFRPDQVIVQADRPSDSAISPLLQDKVMIDGKTAAYVCENFVCSRPVSDAESLEEELRK